LEYSGVFFWSFEFVSNFEIRIWCFHLIISNFGFRASNLLVLAHQPLHSLGFQELVDIRPHHHPFDFADTLYRSGSLYDV
jgi:hypothetical protein